MKRVEQEILPPGNRNDSSEKKFCICQSILISLICQFNTLEDPKINFHPRKKFFWFQSLKQSRILHSTRVFTRMTMTQSRKLSRTVSLWTRPLNACVVLLWGLMVAKLFRIRQIWFGFRANYCRTVSVRDSIRWMNFGHGYEVFIFSEIYWTDNLGNKIIDLYFYNPINDFSISQSHLV